jgi:hypothetical protein
LYLSLLIDINRFEGETQPLTCNKHRQATSLAPTVGGNKVAPTGGRLDSLLSQRDGHKEERIALTQFAHTRASRCNGKEKSSKST